MIEIQVDPKQLDAAMKRLKDIPYAMQRAIFPAVTEMLVGVRAELAGHLTGEVALPEKLAAKAIKVSAPRLSGDTVVGEVMVKSANLPLINYDVDPAEITARKGMRSKQWPGFTYSLRKGQRRQSTERVQGIGLPFIARMPNGHLGIYYRTATQMKQAFGPTVQYHVADPGVEESIVDNARRRFPDILSRFVDRAISEHGGGE